MSENLPNGPAGAPGATDQPRRNFAPAAKMRAASVTISRDGATADGESVGALMDPATQSLADALRITFRLVQLAVLLLVAFYVLSGFRTVGEGEKAIRLVFGRVESQDISPGFRFSWPEPFGELVKVQTGAQAISLDSEFFPELTDQEKKQVATDGVQILSQGGRDSLNPDADNANLTADGNLAHTRWSLTYHREDPRLVQQNITPDQERSIVLGAVKRGIVRAVASVTIDELLKNTPDPSREPGTFRSPDAMAKDIAQKTLDELDSGIRIDVLALTAKIPPRRVMPAFNEVQSAESGKSKAIEDAQSAADSTLTGTAGKEAAPLLLDLIGRYERQVELQQETESVQTLAAIDSILLGEPATVDGKEFKARVVGEVANRLAAANRERSSFVSKMESDAVLFAAKRDSFRKNPLVLVSSDWSDAFKAFVTRPGVQQMLLPSGPMVLMINQDPQIAADIEAAYSHARALKADEERKKQIEQQRFEQKIESKQRAKGD